MSERPYSEDLEKEKRLSNRLEEWANTGLLPFELIETFNYFMERIKELETRVELLEKSPRDE